MKRLLFLTLACGVMFSACGKKGRNFLADQPADSTKLVMLFEVPEGVTSDVAAEEFRYQINKATYSPTAVVWVGGGRDSVPVFQRSAPWRAFATVDSLFFGIHVAAAFFTLEDSIRVRELFYVHAGSKVSGMVRDSLNSALYLTDLLSPGGVGATPFIRQPK